MPFWIRIQLSKRMQTSSQAAGPTPPPLPPAPPTLHPPFSGVSRSCSFLSHAAHPFNNNNIVIQASHWQHQPLHGRSQPLLRSANKREKRSDISVSTATFPILGALLPLLLFLWGASGWVRSGLAARRWLHRRRNGGPSSRQQAFNTCTFVWVLSGNKTRAFSALYYLPLLLPLDLWICFWWWWCSPPAPTKWRW